MKKLMIAAAIVCAAVYAQASSIKWDAQVSEVYTTSYDVVTPGTPAYLILTSTIGMDALVKGLTGAGYESTVSGYALDPAQLNGDSKIIVGKHDVEPTISTGDTAYFVLFNGNEMYVSEAAAFSYDGLGTVYQVSFGDQYASLDPAKDSKGGYLGQSWYVASSSPEPTPEPTSGLLLLLGVAGLALRRKQK